MFDLDRLRAFNARALRALPRERVHALLAEAMQSTPDSSKIRSPRRRTAGSKRSCTRTAARCTSLRDALEEVERLRRESVTIPALELERLRNRQVLFFLDAVSQYVDDQPELRELPVADDLSAIASEFGLTKADALGAVRMALTARHDGPPLALLFPLLGHDRIMIRIGAINSHILHGRGLEPIAYGPGGVPFETIRGDAAGRNHRERRRVRRAS